MVAALQGRGMAVRSDRGARGLLLRRRAGEAPTGRLTDIWFEEADRCMERSVRPQCWDDCIALLIIIAQDPCVTVSEG